MATKKAAAITTTRINPVQLTRQADTHIDEALQATATMLSNDPSPGLVAMLYQRIDKVWKKAIEDQREAARLMLLSLVEQTGEAEKAGGPLKVETEYNGQTFNLARQQSRSKLPDGAILKALLVVKKIPIEAACDTVIEYVPNSEKLRALVDSGRITEEEVESCRKVVSTSLKVESL